MNKLQKVKFSGIDDFLEYLPVHERKIVDRLRALILDCIPDSMEKLSYNVPYYYRHTRICFIWPASVPWGQVKLEGVQLGFCHGYLLNDDINYLEKGDRKQVYGKTFFHLKDIETDLLRAYLFDALMVDEQLKKNKRGIFPA